MPQKNSKQLKLTVCICTYNRSDKLARLLSNIHNDLLIPDNFQVDFMCIDNCSTDDTARQVKLFQSKFSERAKLLPNENFKLHYLYEKAQGLSHARNLALKETNSDWLIFTDDDVQLDANWLVSYGQMIQEYPDASFLGGRVLLYWQQPKPNWLRDEDMPLLSGVLCKYDKGDSLLKYDSAANLPYGASFAMSRILIQQIGEFRIDLGVQGDTQGRGEDTDYFARALSIGANGYYCNAAICYHDAVIERFTTNYLFFHGVAKGKAEYLFGNKIDSSISRQIEIVVKACWQLIKGRRDLYFQGVINFGMTRGFNDSQKSNKRVIK